MLYVSSSFVSSEISCELEFFGFLCVVWFKLRLLRLRRHCQVRKVHGPLWRNINVIRKATSYVTNVGTFHILFLTASINWTFIALRIKPWFLTHFNKVLISRSDREKPVFVFCFYKGHRMEEKSRWSIWSAVNQLGLVWFIDTNRWHSKMEQTLIYSTKLFNQNFIVAKPISVCCQLAR